MQSLERKMDPWTIDAAGVDISALHELPPCRNDVKQFLNDQIGGMKRILVAPKGYGKTLYLKYKARQVSSKYRKSVPIYPHGRGGIEFLQLSLDWKETLASVGRLGADEWTAIWQLVLISKGLQLVAAVDDVEDAVLRDLLKRPSDCVADLLSSVLRDSDHFGPKVPELLRHVRNPFNKKAQDAVIFIDNADEMFASLDSQEQFKPRDRKDDQRSSEGVDLNSAVAIEFNKSNPTIWHSTQLGLLLAIREIERNTPLLSVYTSLRAEAVSAANHPHALQAKTHVVQITYG